MITIRQMSHEGFAIIFKSNEPQPYCVEFDRFDDENGFASFETLSQAKQAIDKHIEFWGE